MTSCLMCGKDTTNPKFCCQTCAAKWNNHVFPKRKTKKKCRNCDNLVKDWRSRFCEEHSKPEYSHNKAGDLIKDLTLSEYWNKDSLKNLHQSSRNAHIRGLARSWFKDLVNKPCAKCGYNLHVELCHIRPINSFPPETKVGEVNSSENIIQLCPNCHWEFDKGLFSLDCLSP